MDALKIAKSDQPKYLWHSSKEKSASLFSYPSSKSNAPFAKSSPRPPCPCK